MKKKLISLLLVLVMPMLVLCGCTEVPQTDDYVTQENTRFVYVEEYTYGDNDYFKILVDKETRVMYLYKCERSGQSTRAGLSVMFNADGSPMLYEGEL